MFFKMQKKKKTNAGWGEGPSFLYLEKKQKSFTKGNKMPPPLVGRGVGELTAQLGVKI